MRENVSTALRITGMAIFACFLSVFVYISVYTLMSSITQEVVGYEVHVLDENSSEVGEPYFIEEKPTKIEPTHKYVAKYSEMSKTAKIVTGVLQVICGVGILFCTTGSVIAKVAAKDRNNADFNDATLDKTKGVKIGLLAAIPPILVYLVVLVLRFLSPSKVYDWVYWFYHVIFLAPVKPIVDAMTDGATQLHLVPIGSLIATIIFIVLYAAVFAVLYVICYNEDSFLAKVLYKSATKKENHRRLGGR